MNLELRVSNLQSSDSLEAHVVRKLDFAARGFAGRVERVLVRLTDMNGPKGGIDKRCRMAAKLAGIPSIIVEATDDDAYVAVTRAAARLHERIARAISKQGWAAIARLDLRRHRHEPEPEPA